MRSQLSLNISFHSTNLNAHVHIQQNINFNHKTKGRPDKRKKRRRNYNRLYSETFRISIFSGPQTEAQIIISRQNIPIAKILCTKDTDLDLFKNENGLLKINTNFGTLRIQNTDTEKIIIKTVRTEATAQESSDFVIQQTANQKGEIESTYFVFMGSLNKRHNH